MQTCLVCWSLAWLGWEGPCVCACGDLGVRRCWAGRMWRCGLGSHSWLGRTISVCLSGKGSSGKGTEKRGLKCPSQHQAKLHDSVGAHASVPFGRQKTLCGGHSTQLSMTALTEKGEQKTYLLTRQATEGESVDEKVYKNHARFK